ncbi:hypothetical protein PBAL39_21940 [Pedobacter sp. BAL39]|nr:hypothetical protein PBAL39_21940 [Pedobacter sp. BAL39]
MVIGVVLPDFIKNAEKDCNLYPLKTPELFKPFSIQSAILSGWERHVRVDQLFHTSTFFSTQSHALKLLILPACEGSPVKPFFLAHIGLELLLDHLLITHNLVNINRFYEQLENADKNAIDSFLKNAGMTNTDLFFRFLNNFISSRYLLSYQKIENISYALQQICKRIWADPFTEDQIGMLNAQLEVFRQQIEHDYLSIFEDIQNTIGG